jgi:hypothetical protein
MIEFRWLSVPDLQHESYQHDAMNHDTDLQRESSQHEATDHDAVYSRGGSSSPVKSAGMEQDPYVPVNYISPDVYTLLAAAEASAACCTDAMDSSFVNLEQPIL